MASAKGVLILEMSIQVWRGASSRYHGTCRYPKGRSDIVGKRGRRDGIRAIFSIPRHQATNQKVWAFLGKAFILKYISRTKSTMLPPHLPHRNPPPPLNKTDEGN